MNGHCKQLIVEGHPSQKGGRYSGKYRAGEVSNLQQAERGPGDMAVDRRALLESRGGALIPSRKRERKKQSRTLVLDRDGRPRRLPREGAVTKSMSKIVFS